MNTAELELSLAKYLKFLPKRKTGYCNSKRMLVPNVWWGFGLDFEIDLLYVTQTQYAHEYELKLTQQDLAKDQNKKRYYWEKFTGKAASLIRSKTFVIPEQLQQHINLIPDYCGIILVNCKGKCSLLRKAKINTKARKLTDKEVIKLGQLSVLRMWKLKRILQGG